MCRVFRFSSTQDQETWNDNIAQHGWHNLSSINHARRHNILESVAPNLCYRQQDSMDRHQLRQNTCTRVRLLSSTWWHPLTAMKIHHHKKNRHQLIKNQSIKLYPISLPWSLLWLVIQYFPIQKLPWKGLDTPHWASFTSTTVSLYPNGKMAFLTNSKLHTMPHTTAVSTPHTLRIL